MITEKNRRLVFTILGIAICAIALLLPQLYPLLLKQELSPERLKITKLVLFLIAAVLLVLGTKSSKR